MKEFNLPLFMKVKPDALKELKENLDMYFPDLSQKRVLILTTEGLLQRLEKKVKLMLSQLREYEVVTVESSSYDYAVSIAKKVSMEGIRMIVGFGGGTALDTAKYAAFVANVPYIAIPTALSNDGVCSPVSVLFSKGNKTHSFTSKTPDGLLIDTDIILESPRLLLEAGVGDIISNYTALYDWELDCKYNHGEPNDFAYMLSERALNALLYSNVKSFTSQEGVKMLAQSLVLGGLAMQIAGSSRPCSGSDHLFCHALDELFEHGLPHGIAVGIGTIGAAWLQKRDYHMLLEFLKEYGIDINPKRRGITEVMFVRAWMYAREVRKERYTILNNMEMMPRRMREDIFKELYALMSGI
ncbi:MAG: iron-containing alcohol dehydrogenase family protein [Acidaminococcaceae bacterium]|nr:iron-containing alcohol dehydrogenase family protein [Acidaminococcaceae bacterium]